MILLLSNVAANWITIAVVSVISGLLALGALNADLKDRPWKYRDWIDADEAKKKSAGQNNH